MLAITHLAAENGHLIHPTLEEATKYSEEANLCERQGRCGLGCIADARHSLDKKIYEAISNGKPIDVVPLCEVNSIEENSSTDHEYKYTVNYEHYSDGKNSQSKVMHAKSVILASWNIGLY